MTEYGRCPAFGYECEYVAKVEAQAAEIKELRGVVDALLQHEASSFFGPDEGKHQRASWRGVIRKAKKARTVYSVAEALDLRKAEQ